MRKKLKSFGTILALSLGTSFACSGTATFLRGEEIEPGVFRVLQGKGWIPLAGVPMDTIGISRVSDFKVHMGNLIASNALVFIGAIDSIIGNGLTSASAPGLIPEIEPAPPYTGDATGAFYARLKIDTLIKGTLPSKHFWFKGYAYGSSCNVDLSIYKSGKFLNFSDNLDSMTDLKMPKYSDFCSNCPQAYWFDGRYLQSPEFPVLRLDITLLYPTYPATGVLRSKASASPINLKGKVYQPDGRRPKDVGSSRKTPFPLFK